MTTTGVAKKPPVVHYVKWCRICTRDYSRSKPHPIHVRKRIEGQCSWCSAKLKAAYKKPSKRLVTRQRKYEDLVEARKKALEGFTKAKTLVRDALRVLADIRTEGLKVNASHSKRMMFALQRRIDEDIQVLGEMEEDGNNSDLDLVRSHNWNGTQPGSHPSVGCSSANMHVRGSQPGRDD